MNTSSCWIESASLPMFPRLNADINVDVIVVGGGLTGITTALLLKQSGRSVALLERGRCAHADTGHTTAHLTAVTDLRLHELIEKFGEEAARTVWDAGIAAIGQIGALVEKNSIDCDFHWCPGYLHAPVGLVTPKDIDALRRDLEASEKLGILAEYLKSVPFVNVPGIRFPGQARFHPLRYLSALVSQIPGDGSHVFEDSQVQEISDDPLTVTANGYRVHGSYLVLATHTPLQGNAGMLRALLFQTKLSLYTSYAVDARVGRDAIPETLFWDTQTPYHYIRATPHHDHTYVILGGEDHKTGQENATADRFLALEKHLQLLLPGAEIGHRWSGQVIETSDGLPFIGEIAPRQFIATGFSGNGMTFGTLAAIMAVDAISGRETRWKKLFDPKRTQWLGGALNYVRENKDYPYFLVKDLLTKGEHFPLEDILPGTGKILIIDGKKIAASRDLSGKVQLCSAVCPHLGGIVNWNEAERTWDCPCHGSRFKPEGEVLSGPAESPLQKILAATAD